MFDALSKFRNTIQKYGLGSALKKGWHFLNARYLTHFYPFDLIRYQRNLPELRRICDEMFRRGSFERIILFRSDFGWDVPLFQRPQHLMKGLADLEDSGKGRTLVLYEVTSFTDDVAFVRRMSDRLYLVNLSCAPFFREIERRIAAAEVPAYLYLCSTDWRMSVRQLDAYRRRGYRIIYDYIDRLNPKISGTSSVPRKVSSKFEYVASCGADVYVLATAEELKQHALQSGCRNVSLVPNGVDYEFFRGADQAVSAGAGSRAGNGAPEPEKIRIGYYGAIACWLDYALLKELARRHPETEIHLVGVPYDDSLKKSGLSEIANIRFLGHRRYEALPGFMADMDVMIIPCVVNDVTNAMNHVKMFEYMAMHKPIVATAMRECRKYSSVFCAEDAEDFARCIRRAYDLRNDREYLSLLDREARENTWEKRARQIISIL